MLGIKKFVPRTLFGRALLIIVIPVVLLQLFSAYIFFERHWNKVGGYLALDLANDIGETTNVIQQHADVVARLKRLAETARTELGDSATKQAGAGVRPPGRLE